MPERCAGTSKAKVVPCQPGTMPTAKSRHDRGREQQRSRQGGEVE